VLVMPEWMWVYVFLAILGIERVVEMFIARRNERRLLSMGAKEHGRSFSKVLFAFHGLWFLSFAVEGLVADSRPLVAPAWIVGTLLLMQLLRYWCIVSLGSFWNTKIIVLEGAHIVRRGPYRWLTHPNYWVVRIEMALYPALFGCFFTAIVFGAVNLVMLQRRIAEEEKALRSMQGRIQP
jgi:methyltransferase